MHIEASRPRWAVLCFWALSAGLLIAATVSRANSAVESGAVNTSTVIGVSGVVALIGAFGIVRHRRAISKGRKRLTAVQQLSAGTVVGISKTRELASFVDQLPGGSGQPFWDWLSPVAVISVDENSLKIWDDAGEGPFVLLDVEWSHVASLNVGMATLTTTVRRSIVVQLLDRNPTLVIAPVAYTGWKFSALGDEDFARLLHDLHGRGPNLGKGVTDGNI